MYAGVNVKSLAFASRFLKTRFCEPFSENGLALFCTQKCCSMIWVIEMTICFCISVIFLIICWVLWGMMSHSDTTVLIAQSVDWLSGDETWGFDGPTMFASQMADLEAVNSEQLVVYQVVYIRPPHPEAIRTAAGVIREFVPQKWSRKILRRPKLCYAGRGCFVLGILRDEYKEIHAQELEMFLVSALQRELQGINANVNVRIETVASMRTLTYDEAMTLSRI